ncbi:unnamed protein product [Lasius platythorax]|uniref:Uncharacterized protein n=1 Tax=Lasius platythorax TaxID=488582 RepID=A0AAV2MWN0_9HYME
MARPRDCGLVTAYAICRGYRAHEDRVLTILRNETRQRIRDFTSYCRKYVREGHYLRIEEVLTFDQRRLPADDMWHSINKYRIFDETHALITDVLIAQEIVYRFHN